MYVGDEKIPSSNQITEEIDTEVKRIAELFRFALKYKEQFQASGIEFSDLREYLPTDDASRIDWKNSAKSQDLFVKEYEEEVDMDAYIILDASDSMMFGTTDKLKSEFAALLASALAYASVDAGINVGIGIHAESSLNLSPDGGQPQYQRILHEVTHFKNYGGKFNLEQALNDTIGQVKEDTAVFLISDFLCLEGEWKSKMQLANIKFRHFMSIMVRDLRDYKLPESGNFRFESPDGSKQMVADTSRIAEEFNKKAEKREAKLKDKIRESGSSQLKIDTRDSIASKFTEFFESNGGEW